MGHTILVVEDTPDSRELMKIILESEGYRVLEAENGVVAVRIAQCELPDAILMDMSLPLMDGCQATKRIRKEPALFNVPIIACTAHNYWEWRSKALLAGCNDFLSKPLDTQRLVKTLARYLH